MAALQPGRQIAKVIGRTIGRTFLDIYGQFGPINDPYTAGIGDEGYMYLDTAQTEQGLGDVYIHVENTPFVIDQARGLIL